MKFSQILLVIVLACVSSFIAARYTAPNGATPQARETAYERVIRTQTLRCGYQYWDSAVMRDEKAGTLYGTWVDIMNAVGDATALKIEWTAQIGWDEVGAALKANKIDAMCAGMWTSALKAKEIAYSTPFAYQSIEAIGRADDHRFDTSPASLNDPAVTISVIDNDNSDFIARQDLPKATRHALGQLSGTDNDLMMEVAMKKGDVTFTVPSLWRSFDKFNAGKLRRLYPGHAFRTFGLTIAVDNTDMRLLNVLNAAEQEIQNSGQLDKILDKAAKTWPDMYIRPAKMF